jgi:hypothetical protein
MHDARSALLPAQRKGHAVCDCCGLITPRAELLPWMRRMQCRELAILDPSRRPGRKPDEEWVTGAFRNYHVTHEHQVCHACFDHLLDGGEFAGAGRHRGKIGFLVLAAVLFVMIVLLPTILPVLSSALWLAKGEN